MKERIAVYLLIAALIALAAISIHQNSVIVHQRQIIRNLMLKEHAVFNGWRT